LRSERRKAKEEKEKSLRKEKSPTNIQENGKQEQIVEKSLHASKKSPKKNRRKVSNLDLQKVKEAEESSALAAKKLEVVQPAQPLLHLPHVGPPLHLPLGQSLATLHLNLAELAHIRKQESSAWLEERKLSASVKTDLKSGNLCFVCTGVRFGILHWSYKCCLCTRSVCSGCLGQLRLPNSPLNKLTLASLLPEFSLSSPSPSPLSSSSSHQPSPSPLIRNTFGRFSFRSSKDGNGPPQGLTRSNTMTPKEAALAGRGGLTRSSTLLEMEVKRRVCLPCTTQLDLMTRMLQEGESREHQAVLSQQSTFKERLIL